MSKLHAKECEIYEGKSLVAQTYGGHLYQHCNDKSYGESVILAKKMAACEDMYRALRDVLDKATSLVPDGKGIYKSYLTQDEVDTIRAALAKADGNDNQ